MTVQGLRKLPLVTFWMLSRNIDRITAEQDIRQTRIGMQVQSSEGFQALLKELQEQMGKIVIFDEAKKAMAEAKPDVLSKEDKQRLNDLGDMNYVGSR